MESRNMITKGPDHMADHKHGEMDTSVQEKTFDNFMNWTTKASIGIIVFLIFLALVAI
jgi:hypothetical protein